jgi:plasmid stability protein
MSSDVETKCHLRAVELDSRPITKWIVAGLACRELKHAAADRTRLGNEIRLHPLRSGSYWRTRKIRPHEYSFQGQEADGSI